MSGHPLRLAAVLLFIATTATFCVAAARVASCNVQFNATDRSVVEGHAADFVAAVGVDMTRLLRTTRVIAIDTLVGGTEHTSCLFDVHEDSVSADVVTQWSSRLAIALTLNDALPNTTSTYQTLTSSTVTLRVVGGSCSPIVEDRSDQCGPFSCFGVAMSVLLVIVCVGSVIAVCYCCHRYRSERRRVKKVPLEEEGDDLAQRNSAAAVVMPLSPPQPMMMQQAQSMEGEDDEDPFADDPFADANNSPAAPAAMTTSMARAPSSAGIRRGGSVPPSPPPPPTSSSYIVPPLNGSQLATSVESYNNRRPRGSSIMKESSPSSPPRERSGYTSPRVTFVDPTFDAEHRHIQSQDWLRMHLE